MLPNIGENNYSRGENTNTKPLWWFECKACHNFLQNHNVTETILMGCLKLLITNTVFKTLNYGVHSLYVRFCLSEIYFTSPFFIFEKKMYRKNHIQKNHFHWCSRYIVFRTFLGVRPLFFLFEFFHIFPSQLLIRFGFFSLLRAVIWTMVDNCLNGSHITFPCIYI